MPDHIRYDLMTQQALRGVVHSVLADAAKKGLPGDHHFYISFDTQADGVRISERLRAQYPEEMTIILQHQFWDLKVTDDIFEVGLSFGGIPEKLTVPLAAINGFFDPSVQFGLQFEEVVEGENASPAPTLMQDKDKAAGKKTRPASARPSAVPASARPSAVPASARPSAVPASAADKRPAAAAPAPVPAPAPEPPDKPAGGGEIVRFDRFRKK
jgi:hypothetical protein